MPLSPPSPQPPLRAPLRFPSSPGKNGVSLGTRSPQTLGARFPQIVGTKTQQPSGARTQQSPEKQAQQSSGFHFWGEDGFTLGDILDVINPLQHLPIIATLYRAFTGNTISPASRVLGDALFGGPIGAATGVANALLEYESGKDVGEHVLTLLHIPSHLQDRPAVISENSATPSDSPLVMNTAPPTVQSAEQLSASLPAANQDQFMAALDAYARNNRLLNASRRQIPQSRLF